MPFYTSFIYCFSPSFFYLFQPAVFPASCCSVLAKFIVFLTRFLPAPPPPPSSTPTLRDPFLQLSASQVQYTTSIARYLGEDGREGEDGEAFKGALRMGHRVLTPSPLPLRVAKVGRNQLNEENTPSSHWDRRVIKPNHIKFRTCSALAPM
jgi:hypothetical protein